MPEGPEIRRAADALESALRGARLESVELKRSDLRPYVPRLLDAKVLRIETCGKAMLIRFDCGLSLYSHNQLYGRWYVMRAGERPRTGRVLRVGLHTASHSALLYSATDIALLTPAEELTHPFLARIGPDVLDPALAPDAIVRRLKAPAFRGRALASLYLDQAFLAGIGNYLRSEILFFARVNPRARPAQLDRNAMRRLARQTLAVTRRSYRTGGITNLVGQAAALENQGVEYEARRFAAYARGGEDCCACGGTIRRESLAARAVFYCPDCQPVP